jgi:hypothetical protein
MLVIYAALFVVAQASEPSLDFRASSTGDVCSIYMDTLGKIGSTCAFHMEESLAATMDQKVDFQPPNKYMPYLAANFH